MELPEAHAAWKTACAEARALQGRTPAFGLDPDRDRYFAELDRLRQEGYDADKVARAAFKAMAYALPEAGPRAYVTPQQFMAHKDAWRTEFGAVKVWMKGHYNDWYPCLARYDINTATGERFLTMTEMFDDCVDEAVRRNEAYAAYYEAQRTGDFQTYYAKYPSRAA